jgi:hypothetical protein
LIHLLGATQQEISMGFTRMLVIAAAVTIPTFAYAQQSSVRGACMNDIQTLCGSMQPGGGRIRECIRTHRTELSEGCKLALAERMMQRQNRGGRNSGPDRQGAPAQDQDQD